MPVAASPATRCPASSSPSARFPLPGTRAQWLYLGGAGALTSSKPSKLGVDSFTWNKTARPATSFSGNTGGGPGGLWSATPTYHWDQNPPGTAVSYLTAPLKSNTTIVGGGAVRLWIKSSAPDVDLQTTITEVRPDGKETFVQDGWLRASERKLDPAKSTLLAPVLTERRSDARRLPKGRWTELTVPLYYEGHVYRAGSRIRVIIAAPSGDQPIWAFANTVPKHPAKVMIAHSSSMPSALILPLVPGVHVPTGLPPCPGLRGEPCRAYVPLASAG